MTLSDPQPPQVSIFVNFQASVLFSQLTFSDVCKPTFSKLLHMTSLYSKKEALLCRFPKSAPNNIHIGRKMH